MNLNLVVRGQSNAILLMEHGGWAGATALVSEVERLLGFDGIKNTVTLAYDRSSDNARTATGGTGFLGDWLKPKGGDWHKGWTDGQLEKGLLRHLASLDHDPTAILWLHSENDSQRADLTAEEWISAVRHDAARAQGALGQGTPLDYLFVSAHPYWGTERGHQAIREGMERLANDPGFRAAIAARGLDLDIDNDDADGNPATREYGGSHISASDALILAARAARAIAENWAAYARPGSPLALSGGDIADLGPEVVAVRRTGARSLEIDVRHDEAGGFRALDPDAASGLGFSVLGGAGWTDATRTAIVDGDTLRLSFGADLPADGLLHYGYGYGRLEGADGRGQGNAVYDDQGLPLWVPAAGVAIGTRGEPPQPEPGRAITGTAGTDNLFGGTGADTLDGAGGDDDLRGGAGADRFVLRPGAGWDWVHGFDTAADALLLRGIAAGSVSMRAASYPWGDAGLEVTHAGGRIVLIGLTAADAARVKVIAETGATLSLGAAAVGGIGAHVDVALTGGAQAIGAAALGVPGAAAGAGVTVAVGGGSNVIAGRGIEAAQLSSGSAGAWRLEGFGTVVAALSPGADRLESSGAGLTVVRSGGGADAVEVTGGIARLVLGAGADTMTLDGVAGGRVSGGRGPDVIVIGGAHGRVVVTEFAGEAQGDVVHGFAGAGLWGGDVLELRGYGEGATLEALGGGEFRVHGPAATEVFTLVGVEQLGAGDYVFR